MSGGAPLCPPGGQARRRDSCGLLVLTGTVCPHRERVLASAFWCRERGRGRRGVGGRGGGVTREGLRVRPSLGGQDGGGEPWVGHSRR